MRFWDALDPDLFDRWRRPRRQPVRALAGRPTCRTSGCARTINVPAGGATCPSGSTATPSRTGTSSSSRRTPVGPGRLDDAGGQQRAHQPGHRLLVPVLAGTPSVPRALPDRQRRRHLLAERHHRRLVGRDRRQRRLRAMDVDLSAYAGEPSRSRSATPATTPSRAAACSSTTSTSRPGRARTSFEDDGDTLDGWTVPGAPAGSPANDNDWIVGTAADMPPPLGEIVAGRRSPASRRSSSSWPTSSGPTRSRPRAASSTTPRARVRAREPDPADLRADFFDRPGRAATASSSTSSPTSGSATASPVERWQHIWLNEGFATYAEWLWSEHEGLGTAQENFDFYVHGIPADDPFWALTIGDPGPDDLFDGAGLRPRRDDAAGAAPDRRRRRLLQDPARLGEPAGGRQRHDRPVHRPGRAGLRPAARHLFKRGSSPARNPLSWELPPRSTHPGALTRGTHRRQCATWPTASASTDDPATDDQPAGRGRPLDRPGRAAGGGFVQPHRQLPRARRPFTHRPHLSRQVRGDGSGGPHTVEGQAL